MKLRPFSGKLGDLRRRHDAAGDGAAQLDVGRGALNGDLFADGAKLQHDIGRHVAAISTMRFSRLAA